VSKRALKRDIASMLAKRDAAIKLIAHYDSVIADTDPFGPAFKTLADRRIQLRTECDVTQATAELLAVELGDPKKTTFSGLALYPWHWPRQGTP
jgi:hypothetical protein